MIFTPIPEGYIIDHLKSISGSRFMTNHRLGLSKLSALPYCDWWRAGKSTWVHEKPRKVDARTIYIRTGARLYRSDFNGSGPHNLCALGPVYYIHSFIHIFIYSFIHSFIHSFMNSHIHRFIHEIMNSSIHSWFIYSSIHSWIHIFIHSFMNSYIHPFIHSFFSNFWQLF